MEEIEFPVGTYENASEQTRRLHKWGVISLSTMASSRSSYRVLFHLSGPREEIPSDLWRFPSMHREAREGAVSGSLSFFNKTDDVVMKNILTLLDCNF